MVMSRSVEFNDVCGEVSVCLYKGWGVALHLCLLKSVTSGLLSGEDDVWGTDAHSEGKGGASRDGLSNNFVSLYE